MASLQEMWIRFLGEALSGDDDFTPDTGKGTAQRPQATPGAAPRQPLSDPSVGKVPTQSPYDRGNVGRLRPREEGKPPTPAQARADKEAENVRARAAQGAPRARDAARAELGKTPPGSKAPDFVKDTTKPPSFLNRALRGLGFGALGVGAAGSVIGPEERAATSNTLLEIMRGLGQATGGAADALEDSPGPAGFVARLLRDATALGGNSNESMFMPGLSGADLLRADEADIRPGDYYFTPPAAPAAAPEAPEEASSSRQALLETIAAMGGGGGGVGSTRSFTHPALQLDPLKFDAPELPDRKAILEQLAGLAPQAPEVGSGNPQVLQALAQAGLGQVGRPSSDVLLAAGLGAIGGRGAFNQSTQEAQRAHQEAVRQFEIDRIKARLAADEATYDDLFKLREMQLEVDQNNQEREILNAGQEGVNVAGDGTIVNRRRVGPNIETTIDPSNRRNPDAQAQLQLKRRAQIAAQRPLTPDETFTAVHQRASNLLALSPTWVSFMSGAARGQTNVKVVPEHIKIQVLTELAQTPEWAQFAPEIEDFGRRTAVWDALSQ